MIVDKKYEFKMKSTFLLNIIFCKKWDQEQLWRFCMAIQHWIVDCIASEDSAHDGRLRI